ncbi:MAG: CoA ester lyase [Pseudaminobacter sp.]
MSPDFIAPLFVPADRLDRFGKAASSGTDAVILDLEDAVAPNAKTAARQSLSSNFTSLPVIVRVNATGTPWHLDDLAAAARSPLSAVMVPKSESAASLAAISASINLPLIALVETAAGLSAAREIAAVQGVMRLAFGSIDFCADLGCAHHRDVLLPARSALVLASRLSGKAKPLDGVTTSIEYSELVADDSRHARALGFGGKLCIHPRQVAAVIAGFQPDEAEIDWARKVLAGGDGASAVDGAMVDEPVRIRARSILAQVTRTEGF